MCVRYSLLLSHLRLGLNCRMAIGYLLLDVVPRANCTTLRDESPAATSIRHCHQCWFVCLASSTSKTLFLVGLAQPGHSYMGLEVGIFGINYICISKRIFPYPKG